VVKMKTRFINLFFDEDLKDSKYATFLYYAFIALFIESLLISIVGLLVL